jgi:hypothetical protein
LLDLGSLAREAGHPGLAQNLLEQTRVVARKTGECLHECHVALQIGECHLVPPVSISATLGRPIHPGRLRCSSVVYVQYAPSSRLAVRAASSTETWPFF